MQGDQRDGRRFDAALAATVDDGGERARSAVVHDISVTGVKLLMRANIPLGTHVVVRLVVSTEGDTWALSGRIVRSESMTGSPLWSRVVAVEFHEPATEYAADIADLHAEQVRRGIV